MKRNVVLLACVALASAATARAEFKAAVVDVQRVVQESASGKESLARVQKLQQAKADDLQKRQKELRDLEQKIQEQGKSLSEEAMDKLQKDYQQKALDMKRFQDDAQRELEESQRKELGELERRLLPLIQSSAKEMGYTLIFNKYQSGLLHAAEDADITDAIITKFNSQIAAAPGKAAAAAPAAKPAAPAASTAKPAATPAPKK